MNPSNIYDDPDFYERYSGMERSVKGLEGAGEWHVLRQMLPDFTGKRVLDLGCGFGWHCRHAATNGAVRVLGIDISERMIEEARRRNPSPVIEYRCQGIENYVFQPDTFDVVISSLAFHYLPSFDGICRNIYRSLTLGGEFVFSVEHPIFTAQGPQTWFGNEAGVTMHWPVDRYFEEGAREAIFLDRHTTKYHRTLTSYLEAVLDSGFELSGFAEPQPAPELLAAVPAMSDELRRPMMMVVAARKR